MTTSDAERKRRQRRRKREELREEERRQVASRRTPLSANDAVAELDLTFRLRGACRGLDPELFFPARGDTDGLAQARAVCASCPVREPCVDLGIAELANRAGGVYGGLSNRQLQRLRRFRIARARVEADIAAAAAAQATAPVGFRCRCGTPVPAGAVVSVAGRSASCLACAAEATVAS